MPCATEKRTPASITNSKWAATCISRRGQRLQSLSNIIDGCGCGWRGVWHRMCGIQIGGSQHVRKKTEVLGRFHACDGRWSLALPKQRGVG